MLATPTDNCGPLTMTKLPKLCAGYVPCSADLRAPGDRRRFVHYARKRGLEFELADPARSYDLVFISASGDFSPWIEYPRSGAKLVFEMVDSYLAIPRFEPKALLRGLAKYATRQNRRLLLDYQAGLKRMCARADAVICSTEEQRAAILPFCRNVHPILDFQSEVVRARKTSFRAGVPFKFGWDGLPGNVAFFAEIREVLRKLAARYPLEIHAVTALEYGRYLKGKYGRQSTLDVAKRAGENIHLHAWEEATVAGILTSCDLGLIPVPLDQPINAGKPENKLLFFWRMGMPAVVSATPAYQRAMRGAGLDMCCRDLQDWEQVLERYMGDEKLREEAGRRGLQFVERDHNEERLLSSWDAVLESVGVAQAAHV